ncbi:hypothetical protein MNV49_007711 [Pseudohyphozyma bogoriensis]|nr:hypothetical protein MNV49_007711 [Pseudohyphozyma bogoriensis]
MDRFNSFASQAKAKAEQGRTSVLARMDGAKPSSSSSGQHSPTSPPASPAPTPSYARSTPSRPANGSGAGVFVGIEPAEKEAFYSLLDEYFASRPQFASALGVSAPAAAPAASGGGRRPAPAPTPRAPAPPTRRGLGTATALYDYAGGDADDLSLTEGDTVVILEKVSDEWWKGEIGGREGIFPATYVQMN